ncbi:metal ABC transporter substrate-binding protein [Actinoplanes sp. NBRC 101535]|uniref:metal ABC transporter substrate-binding protein n=1 Tax=Actinoplanes sp. NBRC 101535 TaxID=3032196 RepID=UPI0024A5532B|nr:metal ABC transporter substrate-binding protein [Actinoplanes sp. NBRC 101535]GLY01536.1 zinc ABC transporter substrate-binding protein [Actinoplanes sp. NBRC 101535]
MMRRLLPALLLTIPLAACGGTAGADDGKLSVVTAFYPLQFVSERIGGDAVSVTNLTKPGAEPHDLELNAGQVGQITEAGLVVYLSGFQPAVDDAVKQNGGDHVFDAGSAVQLLAATEADPHGEEEHAEGEEEHEQESTNGTDPHVWLDPTRLATIGDKLAERLGQADPDHAADYTARAAALHTELTALDGEYTAGLKTCARRELVTSHTAFHYLAEKYDLTQVGITGIDPEAEPSPQRLAEVAETAKASGTTTIFFETLVSPKVAETIAQEVGAKTAVLDPLEGITEEGADYFSVMRANLAALTTALECSA